MNRRRTRQDRQEWSGKLTTGVPVNMGRMGRGPGIEDRVRLIGGKYILWPLLLPPMYVLSVVRPTQAPGDMDYSPLVYSGGLTLISVFAIYPALAKLVAPKASYGKRLAGSTAVAVAVGNLFRVAMR